MRQCGGCIMDRELIEVHSYNNMHIPELWKTFPPLCQGCKGGKNYMTEEDRLANKDW